MTDTHTARDSRIVEAHDPRAVLVGFYGDDGALMDMMAWADEDRDAFRACILAEVAEQMTEDSYPPLSASRVRIESAAQHQAFEEEQDKARAEVARCRAIYQEARAEMRKAQAAYDRAASSPMSEAFEKASARLAAATEDRDEANGALGDAEVEVIGEER